MKGFLLSVLVVGLLAGQASAALYLPTLSDMEGFTLQGTNPGDQARLDSIYERSATLLPDGTWSIWTGYGMDTGYNDQRGPMSGVVGFVGYLNDKDNSGFAWARLGKQVSGTYDAFRMYIQNDDESNYKFALWVENPVTHAVTAGTPVELTGTGVSGNPANRQGQWFTLAFNSITNPYVGFEIVADHSIAGAPSKGDEWYVSTAPIPAALLLGLLGLGTAGLRLRRFA